MIFKDNYFFLSNFYPSEISIEINGQVLTYKNVEAAFQAHKNPAVADKFCLLSGLEAKKIGERLDIVTPQWPLQQVYIMAKILCQKFKNYSLLFQLKCIKGNIVNENYGGDNFWGICKGKGKNILGKLLTYIRDSNNDYNYVIAQINAEILPECLKVD